MKLHLLKRCSWLILSAMLLTFLPSAPAWAASMPSGGGTAGDPFLVSNADELAMLADFPSAHFQLTRDINLTSSWNTISNEAFTGVLDGNGYTISLSPGSKHYDAILFQKNAGTIKNLCLSADVSYRSSDNSDLTFALLAFSNTGTIENCAAFGTIDAYKSRGSWYPPEIASFVISNSGTIKNCYSRVNLNYTYERTASGETNPAGNQWYIGGIAGSNDAGATITNCYFAGSLPDKGGYSIADFKTKWGYVNQEKVLVADDISGCYHDKDLAGDGGLVLGITASAARSSVAMKMQPTYAGWDFDNIWYIDGSLNDGYPVLRCEKQYGLSSVSDSSSTSSKTALPSSSSTSSPTTPSSKTTTTQTVMDSTGTIGITFGGETTPASDRTVTDSTGTFGNSAPNTSPTTGDISVLVNGRRLSFDQPPETIEGRTMVPMRAIFEALGATVQWNGSRQTIVAYNNEIVVAMGIGMNEMVKQEKNGEYTVTVLSAPPYTNNGRTLVPVRAIAEAFDCSVVWDSTSQTVIITD